eukprot:CAMPEP_0178457552 /NCGR_PEP_ID=MMETSP0689_2-20121128/47073_1 /TAXON_ID=160604 /ORGANISM="Amphidinium massartii, Strain CS-259" /LENGTH=652 /DNA_ID=CAMNT_0020083801 /DNA_START=58 /DNA_END=2017 /DNA_ORIENTATION=+
MAVFATAAMTEPLLEAADTDDDAEIMWHVFNHKAVNKSKGCCGCMLAIVSHWWQATTDTAFLQSRISRRCLWKVIFPVLMLIFFFMDLLGAIFWQQSALWPCFDALLFLVACLYASWMSSATLWPDAVIGFMMSGISAAWFFSNLPSDMERCNALLILDFPFVITIVSAAGFHSLTLLWLAAVCAAAACLHLSYPVKQSVASSVLGMGSATLEYILATLYREWRAQLRCNRRLLEAATDGFGVADSCSGEILSASPKLVATLGGSSLIGRRLSSFVVAEDRAILATGFLGGDSSVASARQTVMVTCQSQQHWQQDVRLVPYHLDGSQLGFCVQRLGEARQQYTDRGGAGPTRAEEATVASMRETCPQLQPSMTEGHHVLVANLNYTAAQPQEALAVSYHADEDLALAAASSQLQLSQKHKHLGTLSLSNWTVSADGDHVDFAGGMLSPEAEAPAPQSAVAKKKVETRTLGVQADPLPPAPLSASSAEQAEIERALRKKRLAKAWKALVEEGEPRIPAFAATPLSTRGNALTQLARSSNVRGSGCCSRHVAWIGLQRIITEELVRRCGSMGFCSDWQCPECRALNDFEEDASEEERELEQCCAVCGELVQPLLPRQPEPAPGGTGDNDICSGDDSESDAVSGRTPWASESDVS